MSTRTTPLAPLLVLGLDGATFDVLDPLMRAGRLPNLAAWRASGVAADLPSTVPAMSFPAWSSFLTGAGPGHHGIFDFTQKLPGAYALRFVHAGERSGPSLFARVAAAGGRVLALGIPATFPPEPVPGLLVSGFDAPVSTGTDARSASDPALYRRIARRAGPWMRAEPDSRAPGWHERAADRRPARVRRKRDFAIEALRELRAASGGARPDLAVVVFSESDTAAHHFWRDHDPDSPRRDPDASPARLGALAAVYEALDAACGALREAFGDDALCAVVSDHGSGGASRRVVHLGRRLADCGLLRRAPARATGERLARAARDLAVRHLPARSAERIFRRARPLAARLESAARFGGVDWRRSVAFSEEANTQPGVWINLRGREAQGCVAAGDYERVRQEVIDALLEWRLPGGGAVVSRARRREEVYAGPHVGRAPDVVVELALDAGYGLSLVPTPWQQAGVPSVRTLADDELAGGRGRGMNGTHRPKGVWLATGPGADAAVPASIEGVAPALLSAMGVPADAPATRAPSPPAPRPYTPEEQELVASRLRALGYLE